MLDTIALVLVLLSGLYFVGLAAASLATPARAKHFLQGFAGSAPAHYTELALRLAVGGAFLLRAAHMPFSGAFALFGWVLVVTTVCLFIIPWQWHHRFAQRAVPYAVRNLRLFAFSSLVLGGFVLACTTYGSAA